MLCRSTLDAILIGRDRKGREGIRWIATTLGVGGMLLAAIVHAIDHDFSLREILISLFLFITAPVNAYLLGQVC